VEQSKLDNDVVRARVTRIKRQGEKIKIRTGISQEEAEIIALRHCEGILRPDVELPFDDKEFQGCTVRDVLADPDRFVGATLADPLEGIEYGVCKAKILRRADGSLWIHSFAHGRSRQRSTEHYLQEAEQDGSGMEHESPSNVPPGGTALYAYLEDTNPNVRE
jgi:hypothetical protein